MVTTGVVITISISALAQAPLAHANLPTLGDPTLDSFSSKEEKQLLRNTHIDEKDVPLLKEFFEKFKGHINVW